MALVERIMHWGNYPQDTEPPSFEPHERQLTVHGFLAANVEVLMGSLTVAQIKGLLNMTPADEADYDALIALINAEATAGAKHRRIHFFDAVFMLAEDRELGHNTPDQVRTKLGI